MKKLVFGFLLIGIISSVNAQVVSTPKKNVVEYATIKGEVVIDSFGNEKCVLPKEIYFRQPSAVYADLSLTTISKQIITDTLTGETRSFYYMRIFNAANNQTLFGGVVEGITTVERRGNCIIFYNIPVKEYEPPTKYDDEEIDIQRNAGDYSHQVGGKRKVAPKATASVSSSFSLFHPSTW